MSNKIIIFFDIDGVLSIPDPSTKAEKVDGITAWPVPIAYTLMMTIEHDKRIRPIWMTSWGRNAHAWNVTAGTNPWFVAYPLPVSIERDAHRVYKVINNEDLDGKPLAIKHFLDLFPGPYSKIIWIEDGFTDADIAWSKKHNIHLVDTTKEPLRSTLLAKYDDENKAAMEFIEKYFIQGESNA